MKSRIRLSTVLISIIFVIGGFAAGYKVGLHNGILTIPSDNTPVVVKYLFNKAMSHNDPSVVWCIYALSKEDHFSNIANESMHAMKALMEFSNPNTQEHIPWVAEVFGEISKRDPDYITKLKRL